MKQKGFFLKWLPIPLLLLACNQQEQKYAITQDDPALQQEAFIAKIQKDKHIPDSTRNTLQSILKHNMRLSHLDIARTGITTHVNCPKFKLAQIEDALQWSEKMGGGNYIAGKILNVKGLTLMDRREMRAAHQAFSQALKKLEQGHGLYDLPIVYLNQGTAFYRNKQLLQAASSYKKALYYNDSLKIDSNKSADYIGLAQVYADLRKYNEAHALLDQAKDYLSYTSDYEQYYFYMTQGVCFYHQNEPQQAYAQLLIASKYAQKVSPFEEIMSLAALSETALMSGNNALALQHIQSSVNLKKKHPEYQDNGLNYYLGSLYGDILTANGKAVQANKVLKQLPDETQVNLQRHLSLHFERMSKFAAKQKDYEKAYKYLKIARLYEDTINNEYTTNSISELGQRYHNDTTILRKHYHQAGQEAKDSRQHLLLTILIASICLVFLGFTIATIILRRRNEKRYQLQIDKVSKLRMDVIRNRLSPHFIFNVLGLMLPKFRSNPELHQISGLFIDVLRANLIASYEISIEFAKEVSIVKQYIDLYHKISGEYPKVVWHDATNGEADPIHIPTMCIHIPIENALKHAFTSPDESSKIDIYAITENNRLIVKIIDNGNGYNPGKVETTGRDTGTGLRVLDRTITLLNQKNNLPIEFHIKNLSKDGGKGTEVKLSIPYNYIY